MCVYEYFTCTLYSDWRLFVPRESPPVPVVNTSPRNANRICVVANRPASMVYIHATSGFNSFHDYVGANACDESHIAGGGDVRSAPRLNAAAQGMVARTFSSHCYLLLDYCNNIYLLRTVAYPGFSSHTKEKKNC